MDLTRITTRTGRISKAGNVQQYVNFILIPPLYGQFHDNYITKDNNKRGWPYSSWVFSQFNNTDRKQARATDPWDTAKKFNSIDGWLAGWTSRMCPGQQRTEVQRWIINGRSTLLTSPLLLSSFGRVLSVHRQYCPFLLLFSALSESIQWHFHLNIQFKPIHWPSGWWFWFLFGQHTMQCTNAFNVCVTGQWHGSSFPFVPLREEPQKQTFNSKLFDRKEIEFLWNFMMVLPLQLLLSSINKILGTLIYYRRNCIFAGPTSWSVCNKNSWKYCDLSVSGVDGGGAPIFIRRLLLMMMWCTDGQSSSAL